MKAEIVAGCELDAAVAKAIELQGELVGSPAWAFVVDAKVHRDHFGLPDTRLSNSTYRNGVVGDSWNPSTDANAAFEAAKKAGLIDAEHFDLYYNREQGWMVIQSFYESSAGRRGLKTPALAICAAVLKFVKEQQPKVPPVEFKPRWFKSKFPGDSRRWFIFEPDGDVWIRSYPDCGIQNLGEDSRNEMLAGEGEIVDEPFPTDLRINVDFARCWKMIDGKPVRKSDGEK